MAAAALCPLAMTPLVDNSGDFIRGGTLWFYKPDTLDPVTVYKDRDLSVPWPQPVPTGGSSRVPAIYVGEEDYRVRIFDQYGQLVEEIPFLPGATESEGGGGGGGGDGDLELGDVIWSFSNGAVRSGFVRLNGGTIGSAASSATERANDDVHDLYIYLWGQDSEFGNLEMTPARGASAEGDWLSNKQLALPDARGAFLGGITTMGRASRANLAGAVFDNGTQIEVGANGGRAQHVLTSGQLATHSHGITDPGHNHVATQPAHNHAITDPAHNHPGTYQDVHAHALSDPGHAHSAGDFGHAHGVSDPGHNHTYVRADWSSARHPTGGSGFLLGDGDDNTVTGNRTTGISINTGYASMVVYGAATGISVVAAQPAIYTAAAYTGISLAAATPVISVQERVTGITMAAVGANEAHPQVPPFVLGTFYMKAVVAA